jgi:iron complex outermembrane receptor protein
MIRVGAAWTVGLLLASTSVAQERAVGEMIVTATRMEQPLLDHPGSITRLSTEAIAARGATHHSEIMNRVAGTMIQRGSGQESLTALRSPVLTGAGSCGAFLILEDGIPIRPTGFCNVNDLFEVNTEQADAIEIVRGPGSALYGSNAMHGTVNVLFDDPAARPGGSTSAEGGSDDYVRLKGALADQNAATDWRLLGHWTRDGGFREESGFYEAKFNALLAHRFDASTLRVRLAASNLNQETAGFIQGFEAYKDRELSESNANPEAFRDAHSARLTAHWQHPSGEDRSFDVRAIARSSRMDFVQHFLLGKPLEQNGQDSAAIYLSHSAGSGTQLTVGLDAEVSNSFLLEVQSGPTTDGAPPQQAIRPAGKHYDYEVDAWNAGVYAQVAHALTATLELTAGLRGELVHYDYDNRMITGNTDENGVPCAGGCLYNRPADRADEFTNIAPKFALTWAFQPEHRAYLNAARGFRAPETTELYRLQRQQSIADLDSERIDSVELGVRGLAAVFDYSLAAFWLDKRNVILRDANAFNVSDGRTNHRGIEYELGWAPLASLRLSAAGSFARHRYEFDRSAEQGEQISDGNDVDTAPHQIHSLRVEWRPDAAWRAHAELVSVGEYFVDAANQNSYEGHELVNLALGWQFAAGWHSSLRINNVLDTAYADRADFAFGNYRYFPGRRRTGFIEIGYAFD